MKLEKLNMKVSLMENRLLKMEIAEFLLHKIKVHNKLLIPIGHQCLYKITSSSIKMILKQMATLKEMLKKLSKITLKKPIKIILKKLSKITLKKPSKIMLKKLNKIK